MEAGVLTPDLEDWVELRTLMVPPKSSRKLSHPAPQPWGQVARALVPALGQGGRGPGSGQRGNPPVHTLIGIFSGSLTAVDCKLGVPRQFHSDLQARGTGRVN